MLLPANHDVANAIGAAIASVSGTAEEVVHFRARGHADAVATTASGRRRRGRRRRGPPIGPVVDVEEMPLTYLTEPAARIRVKAAGPLAVG